MRVARERQRNAFIALGAWALLLAAGLLLPRGSERPQPDIDESALLRQENETLRAENNAFREQIALLGAYSPQRLDGYAGLTATIIGMGSASPRRRFATIDAGTAHGVTAGQGVISDCGLTGYVHEAGEESASVILVDDPAFRVRYRLSAGDGEGVVGGGPGPGELHSEVRASLFRLEEGALLVTAGGDGVLPRGIVIGTVIEPDGGIFSSRIATACEPRLFDQVLVLRAPTSAMDRTP